ncbi:MAG: phosphatidylglycerophosphatase A [Xanthomonadales bacterium]|nr:phosphatidylglycerophosphatase A [Xanthomonadales bacterium]
MARGRAPAGLMRQPWAWIATAGGVGLSPWAPGTFGSIAALPFWFWLRELALGWQGLLLLAALALGVVAANQVEARSGQHDPGWIVWDEVIGQWTTLVLAALLAGPQPWWLECALGLACFRLFDIAKPWPIGVVDRHLPGGLGTMIDDALAGVAAGLLAGGLFLLLPLLGITLG